ncbi:MAG: class I SAM-dependent methyltransferase [Armatimonadota bacterium]
MPDPYASVAEHYDLMIDWPARLARERPFYAALFGEGQVRRILDVGCGTGQHTRMFAELGAEAIGLDPSEAMVLYARSQTPGDNPRFVLGGFAEIPDQPGPFDLIAILGNSLAYVRDAADLQVTMTACASALAPGGRLVIQTQNYDSLGDGRWLPLVARKVGEREFIFLREYRPMGERVEFTLITLRRDGEWVRFVERSTHYPIHGEALAAALRLAGFARVNLYGDFSKTPYDPAASPGLLAVAERA